MSYNWLASYLSNRHQFVQFNDTSSFLHIIKYVVLQGSILDPLLLLTYINDLSDVSKILDFIRFAGYQNMFLGAVSHTSSHFLRLAIFS